MEKGLANKRPNIEINIEGLIRLCVYISMPLILVILLTGLSSYLINGNINLDVNNVENIFDTLMSFSIPMLFALGILPVFSKAYFEKKSFQTLGIQLGNQKRTLVVLVIGIILLIPILIKLFTTEYPVDSMSILVQFVIVAIAEELLLRAVILDELKEMMSEILAIIISSLIFAFVYHSDGDLAANLFVRFPIGMILGFSRTSTDSVYPPMMIHLLYNLGITVIPAI